MARGFHERIEWSEKKFSLTALSRKFEGRFPLVAVTLCGFHGANEAEVIPAEEIVRIQSETSQWRAFATDARGRIFSLPLTLPEKFETMKQNGKKSKPKRLEEIVVGYDLPVKISFSNDSDYFEVGDTKYNNAKLGILTLYKFYEERFLRLNTIARGVISKRSFLLPLYVQTEVNIAKGFKDGSLEEWDSLMEMYNRAVNSTKTSAICGLKEVLVYDPSEGKIVNPQAIDVLSDRPRVNSLPTLMPSSQSRQDFVIDNLSTLRLDDSELKQRNSVNSDCPNRGIMRFTNNHKRLQNEERKEGRKEEVQYDVERTESEEDESTETEVSTEGTFVQNTFVISGSSGSHLDKRSQNRTNETPNMDINSKKLIRESDDYQKDDFTRHSDETKDSKTEGTDRERNSRREGQTNGIKQLDTRPIPAKRRSLPTGKVSPMPREGFPKIQKIDDTGLMTEQTGLPSANSDHLIWPKSSPTEQNSNATVGLHQTGETPGQYGAYVKHQSQSTESSSDYNNTTPAKTKKSSLKVERRRSNRAKRHVSYSDTDTVYPFDSTDDMADDSDGPFSRNKAAIFNDRLRNRKTNSPPLTTAYRTQRGGNLVVNVRPAVVAGGGVLPRRRTTSFFPTMTRKQFHASDSSILPRFNGSSAAIEAIPESAEEYAMGSTGGPRSSSRARRHFETSNCRDPDFNNPRRRNTTSVLSAGNSIAGYDNTMNRPPTRQQQYFVNGVSDGTRSSNGFPVSGFNPVASNSGVLRQKPLNNGAVNANRPTVVEWPNGDAAPNELSARIQYDGRTLNINGTRKNGFLPHPEYRQRVGKEIPKNFSSKVIQLNETRDGSKWAAISDGERRGMVVASHNASALRRPKVKDINHFPSPASNGHNGLRYVPSAGGIVSSVTVNQITSQSTPKNNNYSTSYVRYNDRGWLQS